MKPEKTKVTVSLPTAALRRARSITGWGVTSAILAGLEALDHQARRSALLACSLRSGSGTNPKSILVDTSAWIEFFRGREPVASAIRVYPMIFEVENAPKKS